MKITSDRDQSAVVAGKKHFFLNRSFALLWSGQTISALGSHITAGGLQITAVLLLAATPWQMSLLASLSFVPTLMLGLLVGVWVDRLRRRVIMILADLARVVLLLSIPLAALLGCLHIEQLYLVTVLVGVCGVFFDVAYRTFLPVLLPIEQLVEGNSKLAASESLAEIVGPGLAGLLVQIISAPCAILFDGLSFLLSAFCLGLLHTRELEPHSASAPPALWRDLRAGWRVLLGQPLLRALAACSLSWNFSGGTFVALYTLYIIRILKLSAFVYGLLGSMAGVGALLGALVFSRLVRRCGSKSLLSASLLLHGITAALTPLLGSRELPMLAILLVAQLLGGIGGACYFIGEVSLRQKIVPAPFLGRVNACASFLAAAATLSGSFLAVVVSGLIGIRLTLLIGAGGMALSSVWFLFLPSQQFMLFSIDGTPSSQ